MAAVLLLGAGLTACGATDGTSDRGAGGTTNGTAVTTTSGDLSISAPSRFYLRPYGDKTGPADKTPFHLQATDTGADSQVNVYDHRLTVDVSGGAPDAVRLKVVGMSHSGPRCTGSATHVVCRVSGKYDSWSDLDRVYPKSTKDGKAGDTATVRFTFATADGKRALTARTRVVVGEPVVQVRTVKQIKDVRPGADVTRVVAVRNTGEVPVRGLGLQLNSGELDFRRQYANCRYPEARQDHEAICTFPDLRIDPGGTVVFSPTLRLRAPEVQMSSSFSELAWALDMGAGHYSTVPDGGDKGDGPALTATVADSATAKGSYAGGTVSTDVILDLRSDYRVYGARLAVGKGRLLHLKVSNDGPGDPGSGVRLVFTPPAGASVRKQPQEEIDEDTYEPYCKRDGASYVCDVNDLAPGKSRTFDFTLDLTEAGAGTVSLKDMDGDWNPGRRDPKPGNDSAAITVVAGD
ncbi:hypothetical protein OK074_7776 [Actinobacteria bacterium OK074]|nr:hypothetical protein OK074_7776 [Actinobacteria bacterium OK074]